MTVTKREAMFRNVWHVWIILLRIEGREQTAYHKPSAFILPDGTACFYTRDSARAGLKALRGQGRHGRAIIPQIPEWIGRRLMELEHTEKVA